MHFSANTYQPLDDTLPSLPLWFVSLVLCWPDRPNSVLSLHRLQTITDMLNEVDMEDAELILNDHTDGGDVLLQTVDI